jgi:lipopolysaccharide transport system permease protein
MSRYLTEKTHFSLNQRNSTSSITMDAEKFETEYTPHGVRRNGAAGWKVMVNELSESFRLIPLFTARDITVRYRHSVLGYFWAVAPQLMTVGVFAFLHASQVLPMGRTRIPYMAYAVWGISVWQLFAGCLSGCTASLISGGSLVTKLNFPKETLVIAALGPPVFDFFIRLVPVIAIFIGCGVMPSLSAVLIPVLLLPVISLALGLGFILSIANLVVRDTGNAVGTILGVGMFLTPVLYPPPVRWPFYLVNFLNPLSPLLTATQDLIADGTVAHPELFAAACFISLALCLGGWRTFRLSLPRVAGHA